MDRLYHIKDTLIAQIQGADVKSTTSRCKRTW